MSSPNRFHHSRLKNLPLNENLNLKIEEIFCIACKSMISRIFFSCKECKSKYCSDCYLKRTSSTTNCIQCKGVLAKEGAEKLSQMNVIDSILIKCKNSKFGCKEVLTSELITSHELKCLFSAEKKDGISLNNNNNKNVIPNVKESKDKEIQPNLNNLNNLNNCIKCEGINNDENLKELQSEICLCNVSSCIFCHTKIPKSETMIHLKICQSYNNTITPFPKNEEINQFDLKNLLENLISYQKEASLQFKKFTINNDKCQSIFNAELDKLKTLFIDSNNSVTTELLEIKKEIQKLSSPKECEIKELKESERSIDSINKENQIFQFNLDEVQQNIQRPSNKIDKKIEKIEKIGKIGKTNLFQDAFSKDDLLKEKRIIASGFENLHEKIILEANLDEETLNSNNKLLKLESRSKNIKIAQNERINIFDSYFNKIENSIFNSLDKLNLNIKGKINEITQTVNLENNQHIVVDNKKSKPKKLLTASPLSLRKFDFSEIKEESRKLSNFKTHNSKNSINFSLNNPIDINITNISKKPTNTFKKESLKISKNDFLFYYDIKEMSLHMKNLRTFERLNQYLYISYSAVGAEFFNNSIFVCGGNNKGSINNCGIFNLITKKVDISKKLTERKSYVSLIATNTFLACIGGYNGIYGINSCEYFNNYFQNWQKFSKLNNADFGITLCTDQFKYIYTIGGYESARIEQFDISNLNNCWIRILLNIKIIKRGYGIGFPLNSREFLIFGGTSPTRLSAISIFNPSSNRYYKLSKSIIECQFCSSKPIYFRDSIWIVDSKESKIFLISLHTLNYDILSIDF